MSPISDNYHARKTFLNDPHPQKAQERITAVFQFNSSGYLKTIFLNSRDDRDQIVLQRGIERLFKPSHLSWVKRLFQ